MPSLSLTDFVDVVTKAGTLKLTKIRQVKNRPAYSPAADFWRQLRTRIVESHQKGSGKRHLRSVLTGLNDGKKRTAYPPLVDAFIRWWGRKQYEWFDPPFQYWETGELRVAVNPERGLVHQDQRIIVKLYFKSEKLAKNKIEVIFHLMQEALSHQEPNATVAIHDVANRSHSNAHGRGSWNRRDAQRRGSLYRRRLG